MDLVAGSAVCTVHATVQRYSEALAALHELADGGSYGLIKLFVSPTGDHRAIANSARMLFPDCPIIGCTTAGEICNRGYVDGEIVAVGFRADLFAARTLRLTGLRGLDVAQIVEQVARLRATFGVAEPGWNWEFAFLLIDGLSRREEHVVFAIRLALGDVPLFGGSAGDGFDFRQTFVLADGAFTEDTAVLTLMRSRCPVRVFKFDNFRPTDVRMVVTEADPERRIVHEINAEPAAREYARLLGQNPDELSPFTFAAHPVVVSVGGQYHVRAVQKTEPNGDLTFASAIDEGLVLTVAESTPIAPHLQAALDELGRDRSPMAIIACDCVLRRVAAQQVQSEREMSQMLSSHNVVGFSTYGEQYNSIHVNQTFTGLAVYPLETT